MSSIFFLPRIYSHTNPLILDIRMTKEFVEAVKNKVPLQNYRQHMKMLEVYLFLCLESKKLKLNIFILYQRDYSFICYAIISKSKISNFSKISCHGIPWLALCMLGLYSFDRPGQLTSITQTFGHAQSSWKQGLQSSLGSEKKDKKLPRS